MNVKNIVKYEFIGSDLEVIDSRNKSLIGLKGRVVDETQNMFILDDGKKLIKSQSKFKIKMNKKTIEIKGSLLVGRPEDRLKKQIK
jgi:ribonuclease P protein subunit POP4|tara:strand:- start:1660 stop:1917 length:258 start_codon:yes stop_codon:yes gene_type:complete